MPERKIGSNTFEVNLLPAMRSFVLQPRLAPALAVVAEAVGGLAVEAGDKPIDELELAKLAPVVSKFFTALPPAELEHITRELLQGATMDGRPLFTPEGNPFDILLRGRMLDVWKLLWFALQVNYPDFFGALGGLAGKAAPGAIPSEASSTSPPAGPSGG